MDMPKNDQGVSKRYINILRHAILDNQELFKKIQFPSIGDFLNYDINPMDRINGSFIQDLPARQTSMGIVDYAPGLAPNKRCFELWCTGKVHNAEATSFTSSSLMVMASAKSEFGIMGRFVLWDAKYSIQEKDDRKLHVAVESKFNWIMTEEIFFELLRQEQWCVCMPSILVSLYIFFDALSYDLSQQAFACNSASTRIKAMIDCIS